ncbi:MAG: hypothetical protein AAGH40_14705, partial [Verrucomicrobiota bacterium]
AFRPLAAERAFNFDLTSGASTDAMGLSWLSFSLSLQCFVMSSCDFVRALKVAGKFKLQCF